MLLQKKKFFFKDAEFGSACFCDLFLMKSVIFSSDYSFERLRLYAHDHRYDREDAPARPHIHGVFAASLLSAVYFVSVSPSTRQLVLDHGFYRVLNGTVY